MKLIHCADLHLDSPMGAHLTAEKAKARRGEMLHTFSDMLTFAEREAVRAVLICGDLFDEEKLTGAGNKTVTYVLESIGHYPTIDFYYLCGNHEGTAWLKGHSLPENLHLFTEKEWTSFDLEGVTISGCVCEDNPDFEEKLTLDPGRVNLVLLHGQIGSDIRLPKLAGRGIDYLALGHLHTYQTDRLDGRGIYAYSGCLEGRGFDEDGQKGFVLLDLPDQPGKPIVPRFVPGTGRPIAVVRVGIDGCVSLLDMETRVSDAVRDLAPDSMVRVILTGHFTPDTHKDIAGLTSLLAARFFYAQVADESGLEIRAEDYVHDLSLKGEFVRLVMASDLPVEEKDRVIITGLRALGGEEPEL